MNKRIAIDLASKKIQEAMFLLCKVIDEEDDELDDISCELASLITNDLPRLREIYMKRGN